MTCKIIKGDNKLIKQFGYFDKSTQIGECAVKEYLRGQNAGSFLLHNVAINEAYRGKGLCSKFLKCVLKHYSGKTVYLEVLINNIPAVKCYMALGFVEIN